MKGIYPCNQSAMGLARESLVFALKEKRIYRLECMMGREPHKIYYSMHELLESLKV